MEQLSSFPSAATSRYDWPTILSGDVWRLVQGEDFEANPKTLVANARTQARRRGGSIRTRILDEGGRMAVVLQFIAGQP